MLELMNYLITNLPDDCSITFSKSKNVHKAMHIDVVKTNKSGEIIKHSLVDIFYKIIQESDPQIAKIDIHDSLEKMLESIK